MGSSRVSLACIPCRTRHIRCDATRPACRRCIDRNKQCHYAKSRRGGLDREALAAQRSRQKRTDTSPSNYQQVALEQSLSEEHSVLDDFGTTSTPTPQREQLDFDNDPFIALYYSRFHGFHPAVVPRSNLEARLRDESDRTSLEPVIAVIRFIGSIYQGSDRSVLLKEHAKKCCSILCPRTAKPYVAQARLMLSIALFWINDILESRRVMDAAIELAVELGMFRRQFAAEHGRGDPVLEESWRRTWWQIFLVDAYYAAIKRSPQFAARQVDATVALPCEESDYELGEIPVPKTLEDFDSREFSSDDHVYSSFAYLIGAVRCASSAMQIAFSDARDSSSKIMETADAITDGWILLLPEQKRQVMSKNGEVDELMFQAHMGLHASVIGLHRRYSKLLFNPTEIVSSCETGSAEPSSVGDTANIHTTRCLRSIEAQIRLLALPARPFRHTPFTICMMTAGTIPLLSACKFLLKEERLEIARHQIRLSIGCLKSLADVWVQGALHLREIQFIAQEVLNPTATETENVQQLENVSSGGSSEGFVAIDPFGTPVSNTLSLVGSGGLNGQYTGCTLDNQD